MGRFRYCAEEERVDDETSPRAWQFVVAPGEEGSLVKREAPHASGNQQPAVYTIPSGRDGAGSGLQEGNPCGKVALGDYDRPSSGCSFPLWLRLSLLVFLTHLSWFIWTSGPPAPPPLLSGEETDAPSWNDYLYFHGQALLTSGTALFVDLPYHILSWWSLHVHADLIGLYQDWTQPRPCVIELNHQIPDAVWQTSFVAQAQPLAWSKATQAVSSWLWDMYVNREKSSQPFVWLVSSMTPGLVPEEMAKHVTDQWLFASCAHQRPYAQVALRRSMDPAAVRGHLIAALAPWRGQGGVVVLTGVEQLEAATLEWLLATLTGAMDEVDQGWTSTLTTRTLFVLTSDHIGRSSLIRHTRESGGRESSSSSTASLMLDLRHEWQAHGAKWEKGATILPFLAIDRDQVRLYAEIKIKSMLDGWQVQFMGDTAETEILVPPSSGRVVFVDSEIVEALTSPGIVEYICT